MASFLSTIVLPIMVAAVAFVLLLGLINMMRGGSPNRSQSLMRLRVLLQFVASRAMNDNGAGDVLWVPGQNR